MLLADLIREMPEARLIGDPQSTFTGVAYDSRAVASGAIFVAVQGMKADGHKYLAEAAAGGASSLVVQRDHESSLKAVLADLRLPALVVPDTRAALALIAAALYGHPARRLGMIGVTGTDGKTSVSHLIEHILTGSGLLTGLITTAECRIGSHLLADTGRFTTPEAPELQAMLAEMAQAGCQWAVVEATSHGLALNRLDACEFDIAAATVIGRDHLGFHGSLDAYVGAKARLFEMLGDTNDKGIIRTGVINADDPWCERFRGAAASRVVTYGLGDLADVRAEAVVETAWGSQFRLATSVGSATVEITKPGLFSVSNALAACGVCLAAGLDLSDIVRGIATWPGAPGRMEVIDEGQPFTVVVDFAHAPEALERVLNALRGSSRGRIIVVFGCLGEREHERRSGMGLVAAAKADYSIVTDDNPYTEDRDGIIGQIVSGLEAAGRRRGHDFEVVPDRRSAIAQGLAMAVDGDVVLLAGKGHETFVHLADAGYECDDRVVARAVLKDLMGLRTAT